MWIELMAVSATSHRPARVSTAVPDFVADTAQHETGSEAPSDG
jgi:hypothetical protein